MIKIITNREEDLQSQVNELKNALLNLNKEHEN